jgi:hypothetical protein
MQMLREAQIRLSGSRTTGEVWRELGVAAQSCFRWQKERGETAVGSAKTGIFCRRGGRIQRVDRIAGSLEAAWFCEIRLAEGIQASKQVAGNYLLIDRLIGDNARARGRRDYVDTRSSESLGLGKRKDRKDYCLLTATRTSALLKACAGF